MELTELRRFPPHPARKAGPTSPLVGEVGPALRAGWGGNLRNSVSSIPHPTCFAVTYPC